MGVVYLVDVADIGAAVLLCAGDSLLPDKALVAQAAVGGSAGQFRVNRHISGEVAKCLAEIAQRADSIL